MLRRELEGQFLHWASIRRSTRTLLKDLKAVLESGLRVATLSRWALGRATLKAVGFGLGAATFAVTGDARVGQRVDNAVAKHKEIINKVHHLQIPDDREKGEKLKEMIKEDILGKCVADFAVFCREHIDSVLSSRLLEDDFGFLLDFLRGTSSHVTAGPQPTLLHNEVNFDFHHVGTLLDQLQHSETPEITQQILDALQECPSDGEIRTRITDFIAKKFAGACASQE